MRGGLVDLARAGHNHLSPRRMHLGQPLGDDRDVRRSDLEKAVAAEGTSPAALQVLRLVFGHLTEERVGLFEDAFVRHGCQLPVACCPKESLATGHWQQATSLWYTTAASGRGVVSARRCFSRPHEQCRSV